MIRDPLQTLVHLIATEANPHQLVLHVVAEATVLEEVRRLSRTLLHPEVLVDVRIKECCRVSKIPLEFFWERLQLLARILNLIPYDQNYYEVLELDRRASPHEIKQAYRRLCFAFHPDANPDDPHAAERFRNLRQAYEVLSHEPLRSRYDQNLKEHLWDEEENRWVGIAGLFRRGRWFRTWPVILPLLLIIGTIFMVDYSQWQRIRYQGDMGRRTGKVGPGSSNDPASIPANLVGDTQSRAASLQVTPAAKPERPAPLGRAPDEASKPLDVPTDQAPSREDRTDEALKTVPSDQPDGATEKSRSAHGKAADPRPQDILDARGRESRRAATDPFPQRAAPVSSLQKPPPRAAGPNTEPLTPGKAQGSLQPAPSKREDLPLAPPARQADPAAATPSDSQALAGVTQAEYVDREIRSFLARYTSTYEARDMNAFMRLFEPNAIENGRPIQELIPLYQANFKRAEKLRYRIDLGRWEVREGEVMVDGSFNLAVQFEHEPPVESTGTIQLTLVRHAGDFEVKRLNYTFKKPRKNSD